MELKSYGKKIVAANASAIMESGDTLGIAFKDGTGRYQTISVVVRGLTCLITHDQTDSTLIVRRDGSQLMKA